MNEPSERAHILVSGLVQGVFFRAATRARADHLGLTGFVRNLVDGRVEIVAEGPRAKLEALLAWARRGPPGSRVEGATATWQKATGEYASFAISSEY